MSLKYDEIRDLLSRTTTLVRDFLMEEVYHDSDMQELAKDWGTTYQHVKNLTESTPILTHELMQLLSYTALDFGMSIRDPATGKEITFYAGNNLASDVEYDCQTEEVLQYDLNKKGVDPLGDEDSGLDFLPPIHIQLFDASGKPIPQTVVEIDGEFEVDENGDPDDPDEDWDEEGEEEEEDEEDDSFSENSVPGADEEEGDWLPNRQTRPQQIQHCGVRIGPKQYVDREEDKYAPEVRAFFESNFDIEDEVGEDVIEAEFQELSKRDLLETEDFDSCENCLEHTRLPDSMLCHYCTTAGVICNPPENSIEQREMDGLELMAVIDRQARFAKERSVRLLKAACMYSEEEE